MAKAKEGLTAEQLELIRQKAVSAVQYFEYLSTAIDARVGAIDLPAETLHKKQMEDAAHYFQETMENDLCMALEELCDALGIKYQAAKVGDLQNLLV